MIMTETKHVYVPLWGSVCVCVCYFLPLPQRNYASTGCKKICDQVDDCNPVSEKKDLAS